MESSTTGKAGTFLKTTMVYDTVIHQRDRWKVELREIARELPKIVVESSAPRAERQPMKMEFLNSKVSRVSGLDGNFE